MLNAMHKSGQRTIILPLSTNDVSPSQKATRWVRHEAMKLLYYAACVDETDRGLAQVNKRCNRVGHYLWLHKVCRRITNREKEKPFELQNKVGTRAMS